MLILTKPITFVRNNYSDCYLMVFDIRRSTAINLRKIDEILLKLIKRKGNLDKTLMYDVYLHRFLEI